MLATLILVRHFESYLFEEKSVSELIFVADIISKLSIEALSFNHKINANEYLTSVSLREDLVLVCLYDSHLTLFAQLNRGAKDVCDLKISTNGDRASVSLERSHEVSIRRPIEHNDEKVGYLILKATLQRSDKIDSNLAISVIGVFLLGLVAVILIVPLVVRENANAA